MEDQAPTSKAKRLNVLQQRCHLRGGYGSYHAYYPRPKPILRIIKTMLEDKDVFVRRCREGYEFFKSLRQRKEDLAAAKCACQSTA
jgi:hypothetical protein